MKLAVGRVCLGSARAPRAGDCALAIANFLCSGGKIVSARAPKSAREPRVLPRTSA